MTAALSTGCARCEPARSFESFVTEPTSIAAIKALADPPEITVEITDGSKERTGSGACGHSPACIILLPMIVGNLVFPPHFKNATVTDKGEVVYQAIFHHNGEFIRASARKDGLQSELQFVAVRSLKRNLVVEVGRSKLGPDGKPGPMVKTPIQTQVDLLTGFKEFIAAQSEGLAKSYALVEAAQLLGDDAFDLVLARVADPAEPDTMKTAFMRALCKTPTSIFTDADRRGRLLTAVLESKPSAGVAEQASGCFRSSGDIEGAKPFITISVRSWCDDSAIADVPKGVDRLLKRLHQSTGPLPRTSSTAAMLGDMLKPCPAGARRQYLRYRFGHGGPDSKLTTVLNTPTLGVDLAKRLDPDVERERGLILSALNEAQPPLQKELLAGLDRGKTPPDGAELQQLTQLYLSKTATSAAIRALLLARIAEGSDRDKGRANRTLKTWLASHSELPEDSATHIAIRLGLAVTGDASQQRPLARRLIQYRYCAPLTSSAASSDPHKKPKSVRAPHCGLVIPYRPHRARHIVGERALITFGLGLCGCRDFKPVLERVVAEPADAPGQVCTTSGP